MNQLDNFITVNRKRIDIVRAKMMLKLSLEDLKKINQEE